MLYGKKREWNVKCCCYDTPIKKVIILQVMKHVYIKNIG